MAEFFTEEKMKRIRGEAEFSLLISALLELAEDLIKEEEDTNKESVSKGVSDDKYNPEIY